MISQKDLSFRIISSLRDEGKSDSEILLIGPNLILESYLLGEWKKDKGDTSDTGILRYGKDLLKNWMKKDPRLNGGETYIPKTSRGPRSSTTPSPDLRKILDFLRTSDPTNPLIQELEEKIMWEEIKKVG